MDCVFFNWLGKKETSCVLLKCHLTIFVPHFKKPTLFFYNWDENIRDLLVDKL